MPRGRAAERSGDLTHLLTPHHQVSTITTGIRALLETRLTEHITLAQDTWVVPISQIRSVKSVPLRHIALLLKQSNGEISGIRGILGLMGEQTPTVYGIGFNY